MRAQIKTLAIATRHGPFVVESHPDGEVLATLGGNHWFELAAPDLQKAALFFSSLVQPKATVASPKSRIATHEVAAPAAEAAAPGMVPKSKGKLSKAKSVVPEVAVPSASKLSVSKEGAGWGATVAPGRRFVYTKRSQARAASPAHLIGLAGRIG